MSVKPGDAVTVAMTYDSMEAFLEISEALAVLKKHGAPIVRIGGSLFIPTPTSRDRGEGVFFLKFPDKEETRGQDRRPA